MSTALAIELSKPTADQQAEELAALLRRHFEHQVVRQTGSHLRLATSMGGEHRITVPAGGPLRVGTLAAILSMSPSIRDYQSGLGRTTVWLNVDRCPLSRPHPCIRRPGTPGSIARHTSLAAASSGSAFGGPTPCPEEGGARPRLEPGGARRRPPVRAQRRAPRPLRPCPRPRPSPSWTTHAGARGARP